MAPAAKRKVTVARRRSQSIQGTALVSLHTIDGPAMHRLTKALRSAGISDMRPARIILSPSAARHVAAGQPTAVHATIVAGEAAATLPKTARRPDPSGALDAAKQRGDTLKQDLLAAPDMLSTAEIAQRLGMSEEGVRLKRKRHEVLGLELAKRGIRYPSWQILEHQQLLPGLPHLFRILGDDAWTIYRFLLQHHTELRGARALDALRRGGIDRVIATAENIASGAFA